MALVNGWLIFVFLEIMVATDTKLQIRIGEFIFTFLAWISLGITAFIFPPALSFGYAAEVSAGAIVGTICISLVASMITAFHVKQNFCSGKESDVYFICRYLLIFHPVFFVAC